MTKQTLYRLFGGVLCATLAMISAVSAPAQQATSTRIGDYNVAKVKNISYEQKPNGDAQITIRSASGSSLQLTSPIYDITAPQVVMLVKAVRVQGKASRSKVTRIDATGNVKVVNRNRTNDQKTVVTGRTVNYSATTDAADRGTLRFSGNVRAEIYGLPSAAAPTVFQGETGVAKFLPDGSFTVNVEEPNGNGSLTGQFYEPDQKPKGNQ